MCVTDKMLDTEQNFVMQVFLALQKKCTCLIKYLPCLNSVTMQPAVEMYLRIVPKAFCNLVVLH